MPYVAKIESRTNDGSALAYIFFTNLSVYRYIGDRDQADLKRMHKINPEHPALHNCINAAFNPAKEFLPLLFVVAFFFNIKAGRMRCLFCGIFSFAYQANKMPTDDTTHTLPFGNLTTGNYLPSLISRSQIFKY
jgi:hypothetical protein